MFPDKIEEGYKTRLVAQRRIDDSHVVRVVYETGAGKLYVATVYPARRLRYEKISYSKDVDALLIELSDKQIDYAEEEGQMIIHFSKDDEPVLLEILDAKDFILSSLSSFLRNVYVIIIIFSESKVWKKRLISNEMVIKRKCIKCARFALSF